jgi:TonB family protein
MAHPMMILGSFVRGNTSACHVPTGKQIESAKPAARRRHVLLSLSSVLIGAVLITSPGRAQSSPESSELTPLSQVTLPSFDHTVHTLAAQAAQRGRSVYYPRNCDSFLPPEARRPRDDFSTWFSFRVTENGELSDVALFKSSGNGDLDRAGLECAKHIHAQPITVSGTPTEVSWVMAYNWRFPTQRSSFTNPSPSGDSHTCSGYPPEARRLDQEGPVTVAFHIAVDGSTKDLTIARSSGSSALDEASLACVAAYKYYPATQNGQPVEIDQLAQIVWLSPNRTHFMHNGRIVIHAGGN